jgi:RNA polymerase sigma-70 factor, ECF subfamily
MIPEFLKDQKSNCELIRLLNEGDIVAFDAIYKRYCNRLYGFVLRYLKNREDAEEIVQEVFLKIWEARQRIDSYSSFDSFIFTIAYNSTISLLRKRITEKKYLDNARLRQEIANTPDLIDEIQFKELDERVHSLMNRLTPRQQEIFGLSREERLTHEQIAKKLDISAHTVKNHIVATLAFLKSELDNGLIVNILFIYLFF